MDTVAMGVSKLLFCAYCVIFVHLLRKNFAQIHALCDIMGTSESNRMRKEPEVMAKAENLTYRVDPDRFYGELFVPDKDRYPKKALICFSGSDVGGKTTA